METGFDPRVCQVTQVVTDSPPMKLCNVCLGESHDEVLRSFVIPTTYQNECYKNLISLDMYKHTHNLTVSVKYVNGTIKVIHFSKFFCKKHSLAFPVQLSYIICTVIIYFVFIKKIYK